MRVSVRKKGEVNIVECAGTVTLGADKRIRETMRELLEADERCYVFAMSKVPWIDSAGLAEIVVAHKHVAERKGKIVLVLSRKIHDIFTITQLTRVFEIYPDVEEALASFAREAKEEKEEVVIG